MLKDRSRTREVTAELVEAAWCEVLGVATIDGESNFFALGGDSLRAMSLIALMQERFGIAVVLADLLDAPTFDAFVASVRHLDPRLALTPSNHRSTAPMTRIQYFRWKHRRSFTPSAEVSWTYRIDGRLNVDALAQAVDELVRRHDILRTTFRRHRGRPRQVVQPWHPGYLRTIDVSDLPRRTREEVALQRLVDEYHGRFDYARGPLIRPTLIRLDQSSHLFSLACCEMVVDGTSRHLVTSAITELYARLDQGQPVDDVPYPPMQFTDFALTRSKLVNKGAYESQLAYWRGRMTSVDPVINIPEMQTGTGFVRQTLQLSAPAVARVDATAKALGTSRFSILAAAFVALLTGIERSRDIVFTTTLAHRDLPGAHELIGAFYNNIFVSVATGQLGDGAALIRATGEAVRESFRYGEVPLPEVEAFLPRPDPDRIGVHVGRVRFQLTEEQGEVRLRSLRVQRLRIIEPGTDLGILATSLSSGGVDLLLVHRKGIPRSEVDGLLVRYRKVLGALADEPSTSYETILRTARLR